MDAQDLKVFVILPTYNEAENLPILIPQLLAFEPLNILVIDDDSPDGTAGVARDLQKEYGPRVDLVHRCGLPRGLGLAYACGFKEALERGAEIIIGMDADLSHSPSYIPAMLESLQKEGYDIVVGSRYTDGGGVDGNWSWQRKFLSWGAQQWARLLLGVKTRDVTGAFRCYSRHALEALDLEKMNLDGFSFLIEIIYQAERKSLGVGEVPIIFRDREHGNSKVSLRIIFKALVRITSLALEGGR